MNGKELLVGDIFKFEDKIWKCKSNDGFMLRADNINPNDNRVALSWIGGLEKYEVEIIAQ